MFAVAEIRQDAIHLRLRLQGRLFLFLLNIVNPCFVLLVLQLFTLEAYLSLKHLHLALQQPLLLVPLVLLLYEVSVDFLFSSLVLLLGDLQLAL